MSKRSSVYYFLIISFILLSGSCRKFEHYQTDPNNPSQATPALLLTNICVSIFNDDPTDAAYSGRHLTYYERPNVNVNYGWGQGSFAEYDILRQVMKMDELAAGTGENNYRGLAKLFRAILFNSLTERFGDIPYLQSMKSLEGIDDPEYDSQETVYKGILAELEEANSILDAANGTVQGDIIYNGNINNWKKLVNAFRLRVLIHLSKKEDNADLNIRQQFQDIISNPSRYPLMESIDDNGQLEYNKSAINNSYPSFQSLSIASLVSLEKSFVKLLKERQDPRLFEFADPIAGRAPGIFASYEGVDAGMTVANQQNSSRDASRIARRYIEDQINEPMIFISYAEQEFLIAEAIVRNWISGSGSAEEHYNNGITASMKFYDIANAQVSEYLAQPNVKYNPANGLTMILIQKYISFFMNSSWEPFFEQRRTGIPDLSVGPGTINNGQVPKRWQYPQVEYIYNKANVEAAVQRQFNGVDDINGVMWVIK